MWVRCETFPENTPAAVRHQIIIIDVLIIVATMITIVIIMITSPAVGCGAGCHRQTAAPAALKTLRIPDNHIIHV